MYVCIYIYIYIYTHLRDGLRGDAARCEAAARRQPHVMSYYTI